MTYVSTSNATPVDKRLPLFGPRTQHATHIFGWQGQLRGSRCVFCDTYEFHVDAEKPCEHNPYEKN